MICCWRFECSVSGTCVCLRSFFFFFKQKTAYEMRISDWSSDVCSSDLLSLAIGRRGQNVRLASQLTGWDIDILTEEEESHRRQKEFVERSNLFMEALNVDEMAGQVLASEGFTSVVEVDYIESDAISSIDGFAEDTASELQARAPESLQPPPADHTTNPT